MTRKPARMYRKVEGQVYTRREYMGGVPTCRVTQFDTGDLRRAFPLALSLGTEEAAQVRDIALEAARISAVRVMEKTAVNEYHLKVRRYPTRSCASTRWRWEPVRTVSPTACVAPSGSRSVTRCAQRSGASS